MADYSKSRKSSNIVDMRPAVKGLSTKKAQDNVAMAMDMQDALYSVIRSHNRQQGKYQSDTRKVLDFATAPNHRISTRRLKVQ